MYRKTTVLEAITVVCDVCVMFLEVLSDSMKREDLGKGADCWYVSPSTWKEISIRDMIFETFCLSNVPTIFKLQIRYKYTK
jgi:hypothetical protein